MPTEPTTAELSKLAVEDFPRFKETLKILVANKALAKKYAAMEGLYEKYPYLPPRVTRAYAESIYTVAIITCMGFIDEIKDVHQFIRAWPNLDEAIDRAIRECIEEKTGEN